MLILLTNTGTRLEQTMLVIQPPGTHRLAAFSEEFPPLSDQGNPVIRKHNEWISQVIQSS